MLVGLESTIRTFDPYTQPNEHAEARLIYADALLERQDPRGQLIMLSNKLAAAPDDHEDTDRLRIQVRKLEIEATAEINRQMPKGFVTLCSFAHGLVNHVEVIATRSAEPADIGSVLSAPALFSTTSLDLRRAWPATVGKRRELVSALPAMFGEAPATRPLRRLALGYKAVGAEDLDALFAAFPRLCGLALLTDDLEPLWASLVKPGRLVDLEIGSSGDADAMIASLTSQPFDLERLVLFVGDEAIDREALEPIFRGKVFPRLSSFGLMQADEEESEDFLETFVKTPLLKKLTSFGLSFDCMAESGLDVLRSHLERFEGITFFSAPGSIFDDSPDWDNDRDDLARFLDDIDRDEEALRIREDLIITQPKSSWHWDNLGMSLRALERWEEALVVQQKAIALDRKSSDAWQGKADALYELHRPEEALVSWDKAIELNDSDAWAHNGRGMTLQALNRRKEALDSYVRAAELDSSFSPYMHNNRAEVFHDEFDWKRAYREYELCARDKSSDEEMIRDAINGMGRIRLVQGDTDGAAALFETAATHADDVNEADHPLTNLAQLYVETGKLKKALAIWDRLVKGPRPDDYDRGERGWLLLEMGKATETVTIFDEIDYADAARACAYVAAGREDDALALLTQDLSEPATGCIAHRAQMHLVRAAITKKLGPKARPNNELEADLAVLDLRAKPKGKKQDKADKGASPYAPRALHGAFHDLLVAGGAEDIECEAMSSCAPALALTAATAAWLRGDVEQACERIASLRDHFTEHGMREALPRAWEVRFVTKLLGLSDPRLTHAIRLTEGFEAPAAFAWGKTAKPAKPTPKPKPKAKSQARGRARVSAR